MTPRPRSSRSMRQRRDDRRARPSRRQSVAVAAPIVERSGRGCARTADRRRGRACLWRQVSAARRGSPASTQAGARSRAPPHGGSSRLSLHPSMPRAESGRVRGLRGRQVVAPGDAGSGDADRHRRHRARRRARPRSARIPPRNAWRGPRVRGRRRFDRRREPHDAPSRAENSDGDRRIFPRSRGRGVADRQFGHPLCSRRARCGAGGGRARRRSRLCAERLQRSAAAPRARWTGHGRIGFNYRRLFCSGRWRRPQRSGRRCDSRSPRRAHRVGARDRR